MSFKGNTNNTLIPKKDNNKEAQQLALKQFHQIRKIHDLKNFDDIKIY